MSDLTKKSLCDLVKGIKDLNDSFESETFVLHKSSKTKKKIKKIVKK